MDNFDVYNTAVAALSVAEGKEGYIDYSGEGAMTEAGAGGEIKNPLLSSWIFVIGVSAGVLIVSIVLGILLAKRKIKKGIDLYED